MGYWGKVSTSTLLEKVGVLAHTTVLWAKLCDYFLELSVSFFVMQASCCL